MLVRSCLLITLIKCLKGHSVMSKVKVSESVSESVTRSPIELLWTAKKPNKLTDYSKSMGTVLLLELEDHYLCEDCWFSST